MTVEAGHRRHGSGRRNFRVPDLTLVPPDRLSSFQARGWVEEGAPLVVELRSPREVVRRKLAFYAAHGVEEVLYVDYRTWQVEAFRLDGDSYVRVRPDRRGFVEIRSAALRVRRVTRRGRASLQLEDARGGGPLPPL